MGGLVAEPGSAVGGGGVGLVDGDWNSFASQRRVACVSRKKKDGGISSTDRVAANFGLVRSVEATLGLLEVLDGLLGQGLLLQQVQQPRAGLEVDADARGAPDRPAAAVVRVHELWKIKVAVVTNCSAQRSTKDERDFGQRLGVRKRGITKTPPKAQFKKGQKGGFEKFC